MTQESFETQLGRALHQLVPSQLPRAGLAASVPARARRRRTIRRVGAGAASVAAVTLIVAVAVIANSIGGRADSTPAGPPPAGPPPVDRSHQYLTIDPAVVAPGHGAVSIFVVNPTAVGSAGYGVQGDIQLWDGRRWRAAGFFVSGWAGGVGRTYEQSHPPVAAPAIGFQAPAGGNGPLESVDVSRLPAGLYRFGHNGAWGVLEIRPGATATQPVPPPAADRSVPYLAVEPSAVPVGSTSPVALLVVNPTRQRFETYGVLGRVQRWTGARWQDAGSFSSGLDVWGVSGRTYPPGAAAPARTIGAGAPAGGTGPLEWLDVGRLQPGYYRLGHRASARSGTAWGLLQVRTTGAPVAFRQPQGPAILAVPAGVRSGRVQDVPVSVVAPQAATEADRRVAVAVGATVRLERADGDGWAAVEGAERLPLRPRPTGGTDAYSVILPGLDAGLYRLMATGEVWASFWVLDR